MTSAGFQRIADSDALEELIAQEPALALWFSGPDCGVCAGLRPKLEALFADSFPKFRLVEIACAESPELAASYLVFSVPTLIVFFDGRESLRLSRNLSLAELRGRVQRGYTLLFGQD